MAKQMKLRLMMVLILAATPGFAQVPGQLVLTNGATVKGLIKWNFVSNYYTIENSFLQIGTQRVAQVVIVKPKGLDQAIDLIHKGDLGKAVPLLESILKEYNMLQWDVEARRLLEECHNALHQKRGDYVRPALETPSKQKGTEATTKGSTAPSGSASDAGSEAHDPYWR